MVRGRQQVWQLLAMILLASGLRAQLPESAVSLPANGASSDPAQSSPAAQPVDPPTRVVRVSLLQGDVSVQPASVTEFTLAEVNQVLTSGDRVYTDPSAFAELEAGQIALRLGGGADLTVTALTDQVAQFGLASGSVHLRSYAMPPGTVLELDSPEVAITVLQPGDLRVDEDAAGHTTSVAVVSGGVQIDGPGFSQKLNTGDQVRVHAPDVSSGQAAYVEPLAPGNGDALDTFSDGRDSAYANGIAASTDYMSGETTGTEDLASYGSWDTGGDYGAVWFPAVAVGWRPYCYGHWAWVSPWGWTWVGAEPWAFAPSHYGRWLQVNGRWGWLPGTRSNKPVYAPAMVAFVGGRQFSAALGYPPGAGVAAWFPLGPREPYTPWYHGSTLYLNRVNASNLYNPNASEARTFYNQRAVNVYANALAADHPFANRAVGTVAMPEANFAAGQAVARNQVRLSASQLAGAPVILHPAISPERSMVVRGTGRAIPPPMERTGLAAPGQVRGSGASEGEAGSAVYANRPAFVHAQTPPVGLRPSFAQERQAMDRAEPGRPVATQGGAGGGRPVRSTLPSAGRETAPRPSSPGKAAEPARPAPAPTSPANNPHH